MRRLMISVSVLYLSLLSVVFADGKAEDGQSKETYAVEARQILRRHCARCHNGPGSEGGEMNVTDAASLKEDGVIVPEDSEGSYLLEKILTDRMPPRSISRRVSAFEGEIIRKWITSGAADFPEAEQNREFLSLEKVLTGIRDFLREQPRETRQYLRFFTIHNLYNNPKVLDEDLALYRAALSKAINSLSWQPRIILPEAIDRTVAFPKERQGELHDTVYVINTQQLGWDKGDLWHEVARLYPYGLSYGNLPDERLRRLDEDIQDLTHDCQVPLLRVDWFTASAMRPPLYHTLLGIPDNAKLLEHDLGVDIAERFSNAKEETPELISRGAFAKSGVSGQNRLVERHDAKFGFYWKSYDFKAETARGRLTRFPLGPRNLFPGKKHPFDRLAFEHDGGEIIWALPNGLQAYMLIDGNDNRINEGPVQVVSDALKTSGTPAIVNGVSCMACHRNGMIPFRDTVRDRSAVFGDAEEHVRRLYPKAERMSALVQEDAARYQRSLEKVVGPFLKQGVFKDVPVTELPEPVGDVARLHRLGYLDLKTIACELDIKDPQDLLIGVGAKRLKQLGLDALLEEGGVIGRLEWEAFDGPSLMQQLARELRFTPFRPL